MILKLKIIFSFFYIITIIKMAESGCLYNEKFNNIDVDNRLDTNDTEADNNLIYVNTTESNEDTESTDYSSFLEGQMIEIYKKSNPMSGATLPIEVTWPEGTLLKTITLMFTDGTGTSALNSIAIALANNLRVKLGTKKESAIADASIMSSKILVGNTSDAFIYKNIPVTIINNFTGIIGTGSLGDIKLNSPAFHSSSNTRAQAFDILDSDHSTCWSKAGAVTGGPYFPLYNPSGTDKRDKIVITLEQVVNTGGAGAAFAQAFKVAAICTFVKMSSDF